MGKVFALKNMKNNLKYPKQYVKKGIEISSNWHRYYSARLGRYFKADLTNLKSIIKQYSYSDNNPLIFFDPLGLKECSKCDQCPGGKWRIEDWGSISINFKLGKSTISWDAKIHCMSLRPGEYIISPLEHYPITIKCDFEGVDIGGSISIGGGQINNKCNISDISQEEWEGLYFSPPILPVSGIFAESDLGSNLIIGWATLNLEIGGGAVKCRIHPKNENP